MSLRDLFSRSSPPEGASPVQAFLTACRKGNLSSVQEWLKRRPDEMKRARTAQGEGALHLAARYRHMALAAYLLVQGFDPTDTNAAGEKPRDLVMFHQPLRDLLRKAENDKLHAEKVVANGRFFLNMSSTGCSPDYPFFRKGLEQMLLETPEALDYKSESSGRTPLLAAAASNNISLCLFFLDYPQDVNARDSAGCTALWHAARYGHNSSYALADRLLKCGADIFAEPTLPGTPTIMEMADRNPYLYQLLRDAAREKMEEDLKKLHQGVALPPPAPQLKLAPRRAP